MIAGALRLSKLTGQNGSNIPEFLESAQRPWTPTPRYCSSGTPISYRRSSNSMHRSFP
ncbi:hypothetical protein CCP4SC76_7600008 [Gammaproteobacteria bacterium]